MGQKLSKDMMDTNQNHNNTILNMSVHFVSLLSQQIANDQPYLVIQFSINTRCRGFESAKSVGLDMFYFENNFFNQLTR